MADVEPWDRQPGESARAYEAFRHYRDAGATRSHAKTGAALAKTRQAITEWSRKHGWSHRIAAWDAEQDRLWQIELRDARQAAARRNIAIARGAMTLVSQSIVKLVNSQETLSAADAARLMDAASKLERMEFGQPTHSLRVSGGVTVETPDVGVLSDEERRARMSMLQRELASRLDSLEPPPDDLRDREDVDEDGGAEEDPVAAGEGELP